MKKRRGLTLQQREMVSGYMFIAPWLVGVVVFFLYNLVQAVRYSFNTITINPEGGYTMAGVGVSNYAYAFLEHATFNRELAGSLTDMLINVPLIVFFSLLMAILLNRKFAMRGIVRAIFFLPVIMATTAVTGAMESVLRMMLGGVSNIPPEIARQQTGFSATTIAYMLGNFGMPMTIVNYIVQTIQRLYDVIRQSGVQILIFLAALQAIPGSLYEVAHIEGATAYETFWKITFPMVSPLILTNVIYTIVDSYTNSRVVKIAFDTAFANQNFGLSSAMSVVSSLSTCLVLLVVGYAVSRNVFYQT